MEDGRLHGGVRRVSGPGQERCAGLPGQHRASCQRIEPRAMARPNTRSTQAFSTKALPTRGRKFRADVCFQQEILHPSAMLRQQRERQRARTTV
jgi:hypothetical protein